MPTSRSRPSVRPSPCPAVYPANFPRGARRHRRSRRLAITFRSGPRRPIPRWPIPGRGSRRATAPTTRCRSTSIIASATAVALRGVYTWSKALDDGDSLNATTAGNAPGLVSNPYNLHADWGLATYDVRNVGVISAVYDAALRPRQSLFGNDLHGFANCAVSGWSVNSIVTLQCGFPFTPQLSYNPSNNGDTRNPVRPFVNPDFHGKTILGNPTQWFNPAAFLAPPANSGFYGNLGRDTLIGPGLATWDFSASKTPRSAKRLTLQFRAESSTS